MPPRKKKPVKFTPPEMVNVCVNRNGSVIEASVRWADRKQTLGALLETFRELQKEFPELLLDLGTVGGSSIPYVDEADEYDRARKVGFT